MDAHLGLVLLVLLSLLVRLCLLDGGCPCGQTLLCALVSPCGNGSKVGTDNATLVLDGLTRPLLGNLLRDTLLVHATVRYRPGDLTGVLALQEERLILGGGEAEDLVGVEISMFCFHATFELRSHLAVSTNKEAALAGVDTEAGERVDLDLLYSETQCEL